jgi:4-azaleucine resistance transporter AzlC
VPHDTATSEVADRGAAEGWRTVSRGALRDTVPVAMGYMPLGAAYGLLLVNAGLSWYWAPVSSLVVFAGAMQFLAVSLLAAGVPPLQIAATTAVVNFRHVFYGLSFPLHRIEGRLRRLYGIFALTDETYSLVAAKRGEELSGRRIHLIQVFSHGWWVLGSTLGAAASVALPHGMKGLDFALVALFVVLAQEHAYRRSNHVSMLLAGLAALLAYAVLRAQFLAAAIGFFLVFVAVRWWLTGERSTEGVAK